MMDVVAHQRRREPGETLNDICTALAADPDAVYLVGSPTTRVVMISPARWAEIRRLLGLDEP